MKGVIWLLIEGITLLRIHQQTRSGVCGIFLLGLHRLRRDLCYLRKRITAPMVTVWKWGACVKIYYIM